MSTPISRAAVLRGTLVGVCSAIVTAGAHAAAGGTPLGGPLVVLALTCAAVGAAVSTVTIERYVAKIAALAAALGLAQSLGHLVLAAGGHHGMHAAVPSPAMLAAHGVAAVALATMIALVEFLGQVAATVSCWLRLVAIHRVRAQLPPWCHHRAVVVPSILLRSGMGMRAPPRGAALGV